MKRLLSASLAVGSMAMLSLGARASNATTGSDVTIPVETLIVEETLVVVEETLVVEIVEDVGVTDSTIYSPLDDDVLEAALLTVDDLNAAPDLDYLGDGWQPGHDGLQIEVSGDDRSAGEGLCPEGDSFVLPASQVGVDLIGGDGVFVFESVMSFEHPESADSWVAAYESCPEEWKEEGDPDEYVTVEPIEIADLGEESSGFRLLYEHTTSVATEHDEAVAFVRLSPSVLVALYFENFGESYDPTDPYDPSILDDLTSAAVAKAGATLG